MSLKPVRLLQRYGSCNAGEIAGYEPDEVARMVKAGVATEKLTDDPPAPTPAKKGPVLRTRLEMAGDVEIPTDFATALNAKKLVELGTALAEPAPANRNEALEVIEAELAARNKQV